MKHTVNIRMPLPFTTLWFFGYLAFVILTPATFDFDFLIVLFALFVIDVVSYKLRNESEKRFRNDVEN